MGFGWTNGTSHADSSAHDRQGNKVKAYFDNAMTVHTWAQLGQSFGRSGNGNLFFEGRALYSYGSHYVAGYILPAASGADQGRALLNADSYSISTSGHVGDAHGATRHLAPCYVPELTNLARMFESGLAMAAVGVKPLNAAHWREIDGGDAYHDGAGFARKIDRKALSRHMAPRLKEHFSDPANCPGTSDSWRVEAAGAVQTVAACFAAAACSNPERRARACVAAAEREASKILDRREKARVSKELAFLSQVAKDTTPAFVTSQIEKAAKETAPRWRNDSDVNQTPWAETGRKIHRAIKAGRAAGRVAQVAKAQAVYKAIRAALPEYDNAATRHAIARHWKGDKDTMRAALTALAACNADPVAAAESEGLDSAYRGQGGPNRNGFDVLSDTLEQGAGAAHSLRAFLGHATGTGHGVAIRQTKAAGVDVDTLADKLDAIRVALFAGAADMAARGRRFSERAELAAIRAALAACDGGISGERLKALKAGQTVANRYAENRPILSSETTPRPPYNDAPNAWKVAGYTPAAFRVLADTFTCAADVLTENLERDGRAMALELWRAGESIPRELARYAPHAMEGGAAYIRAVGVERDGAGMITGGTLETSQGAKVPLAHAIKVFQFCRLCRTKCQDWTRNGRTLRAGHFSVDHVQADGGFKAGCHTFRWPEIAELARELGVFDLAPADTTAESANAH